MKLYEHNGLLWEHRPQARREYLRFAPICPTHRLELYVNDDLSVQFSSAGYCDDCGKTYEFGDGLGDTVDYLVRKVRSTEYKDAEVVSLDGIQTPIIKVRKKLVDKNEKYWIEARVTESKKGRHLVIYVGQKGLANKVQLFSNIDQGKLSFDHADQKPTEIFTSVIATFPGGSKMSIEE